MENVENSGVEAFVFTIKNVYLQKRREMKSLFTAEKVAEALEKFFLLDRFVKWEGNETPSIIRFLNHWNISDDKTLKIYKDDGYYLAPVGSWIVMAPDGSVHAFGEGVRFVSKELDEAVNTLHKEISEIEIPIHLREEEEPITTYIPEDPYETEVVEEGNAISLRRKLDKDGNPILKKNFGWNNGWKAKFKDEVDKWKK